MPVLEPHDTGDELLRRADRLVEAEQAELSNAEIDAVAEFRRSVHIARQLYDAGGKVTRETIFENREPEEPDLTFEGMVKRWNRAGIRIRDVKAAALRK